MTARPDAIAIVQRLRSRGPGTSTSVRRSESMACTTCRAGAIIAEIGRRV